MLKAGARRESTPSSSRRGIAMQVNFTLDCADPARLADFWSLALRCSVKPVIPDHYVAVEHESFTLTLQRVPEPKATKNRMHLDLLVDDLDAELVRIESLGATRLTADALQMYGERWFVLADPEGNEFSLAEPSA
jgi:predicted enzyme related to lactoylglutathione lyase